MRVEKSFRGISKRLAVHYLVGLGGDPGDGDRVVAEDWEASLSTDTVAVGPSLTLTEVTVVFEGDPETLDAVVEQFSQKAIRAGG